MSSLAMLVFFGGAAWGMARFLWIIFCMIAKEAVLGGNLCHSVEQAVPETTPNDEQPS